MEQQILNTMAFPSHPQMSTSVNAEFLETQTHMLLAYEKPAAGVGVGIHPPNAAEVARIAVELRSPRLFQPGTPMDASWSNYESPQEQFCVKQTCLAAV